MQSLSAMQKKTNQHLSMADKDLDDETYLHRERCVAETNFIKATISYKIWNDIGLTESEYEYLNVWSSKA